MNKKKWEVNLTVSVENVRHPLLIGLQIMIYTTVIKNLKCIIILTSKCMVFPCIHGVTGVTGE